MANILVTGASTGIGLACVELLAQQGHTVFAGVRKQTDADSLSARLSKNVVPVIVDVTSADQMVAAAAIIEEHVRGTGPHGLVNNAGIAVGGPLEHLPLDRLRDQLEVNVVGQVAMTQAMLPLVRRANGRIIFVGSVNGRIGTPMMGAYVASKFALEGLTESLRLELAPWGIKVVLIEPGSVKTEIWDKGRSQADELEQELSAEVVQQYAAHITMVRRLIERQDRTAVQPLKVAKAVEKALFAPRPMSRYLVGIEAKAGGLMARILPDQAKAAVLDRALGTKLPKA